MLYLASSIDFCVLFDAVNSKYSKTPNSLESDYPAQKQANVVNKFCGGKERKSHYSISLTTDRKCMIKSQLINISHNLCLLLSMLMIRIACIFSNIYIHLIVIMASKAHEGAGGNKGAEEEKCIIVKMMNELQF
jgi:hypothetical protein